MNRNPCHGWADGDPVTFLKADGSVRAIGKVIVRKSNAGTWYLKVQLQTVGSGLGEMGQWVWPEGWIIGQGKLRSRCFKCDQDYLTDDPAVAAQKFCPPCERREMKARAATDSGIRNLSGFLRGARQRPAPRKPLTDEQRERIRKGDEEKARDAQESPF